MSASPVKSFRPDFSPWQFGAWLALLVFAAFPQVILGVETFVARDFGFFAYPLAHFQRDCFWHGELPFWDPYNNCGVPFLAQWNTMPLYPPSLVYLTLPLEWSLGLFSLLHLWWAGVGMYFLARRWTGNTVAAALAGTVFAFNGFTLNLLMWPSHIATFSWLPWVMLSVEAAWRDGGKKIPLAAGAGALQMLAGGPETILLTWFMASALWLQQFFFNNSVTRLRSSSRETSRQDIPPRPARNERGEGRGEGYLRNNDHQPIAASSPRPSPPSNGGEGVDSALPPRAAMLWRFALVVVLVMSLAAAQLLPFLDLVGHAQREAGYTDLRWSMPGTGLANFLVPMAFGSAAVEGIFFQHGQYWTSSYYLGIGTVWLALLALVCVRDRRVWLLAGIAVVGLLCALGEHTPFYPLVRKLVPQLSFITYPIKFVMVAVFAAPLLAALAFANLKSQISNLKLQAVGGVLLVLLAGVIAWTQLAPHTGDDAHAALWNGISRAGFLCLTGTLLVSHLKFEMAKAKWLLPMLLILAVWLDVATHEPKQNPTVPPVVYEPDIVRMKLAMQPQPELGGSRAMLSPAAALELTLFAASDSKTNFLAKRIGLCANVNLLDAMPKVDGFFSLTPREFDFLLTQIYSVTNGNWAGIEDFMGVSQTTAPDQLLAWQARTHFLPLITAGQKPVFLDDNGVMAKFEQNEFDGRQVVYLPPEVKTLVTVSNGTSVTVVKSRFGNRLVEADVEADGPSFVVIAQTYYHNWRAEVDGRSVPLLRANLAFQAVQIPAGTHQIHLFYDDRAFEIGAAVSVCMLTNCLVAFLALRRLELPPSPAPKDGGYF